MPKVVKANLIWDILLLYIFKSDESEIAVICISPYDAELLLTADQHLKTLLYDRPIGPHIMLYNFCELGQKTIPTTHNLKSTVMLNAGLNAGI